MEQYLSYSTAFQAPEKVQAWIKSTLKNYLAKNSPSQDEVEHIIDYLISSEAPNNVAGMSYEGAKGNTEKWNTALVKKGAHIKETEKDTETVLDFKDGFKIVKLVGKNAYDREGYLMRHCVASYFGKSVEIFSLRDKDNMPHCTMEKDAQIKGKGNGDIHPNYVEYIVKFLEHVGMTVGDNEMKHLGYINMEKFKKELSKDTKYFNKVYLPTNAKLIAKDGGEFASLELWNVMPLISRVGESLKINFELSNFIKLSVEYMRKSKKFSFTSGDDAHSATSGEYANSATSGEYAHSATSGYGANSATSGNDAHSATSGEYAHSATSGNRANSATSGYDAHSATSGYGANSATSGNDAHSATSGEYAHSATSGNRANSATSGYGAHSATSGADGIACSVGRKAKAKATLGCWIVLAEWEEGKTYTDAKPINIKSAQVDDKKIKADTWYKLVDGKFVITDDKND